MPACDVPVDSEALSNTLVVLSPTHLTEACSFVHSLLNLQGNGSQLTITTRYFKAMVDVIGVDANEDIARAEIGRSGAVLLIAKRGEDVDSCKQLWTSVADAVNGDSVCLFVVVEGFDESASYHLVAWAVPHGVEVVTSVLCDEDGTSVAQRVTDAVQCAPWHHSRTLSPQQPAFNSHPAGDEQEWSSQSDASDRCCSSLSAVEAHDRDLAGDNDYQNLSHHVNLDSNTDDDDLHKFDGAIRDPTVSQHASDLLLSPQSRQTLPSDRMSRLLDELVYLADEATSTDEEA